MKKIYALEYTGKLFEKYFNLGDDIQTLAVSRLLPRVDGYVCREALNQVTESCIVPLNGFFMNTENWPPSPMIKPVFFSFHLASGSEKIICSEDGIEYLKRWQPIGCRDRGTMNILARHGVETYYSRCVTLTLPRRKEVPKDGQIFIVGVPKKARYAIPKDIRSRAITVDQAKIRLPITNTQLKLALAKELLAEYCSRAKLVITSKIHCAMPCIAMGIPVVFLYDSAKRDDYRVKIISDLIKINYVKTSGILAPLINTKLAQKIDWSPLPLELDDLKAEITQNFQTAFERIAGLSGLSENEKNRVDYED